ncbi:MAG TPA: oligosaccharide flippase family protein, partial [Rugosibacter sp.]|nr:oligosaccharide flippase family protein [Rugosibacter sp.]
MAPSNNPKTNLIRGAAWTVGTRWLIKGLGFINTVIMARLLMSEDYGIVAMGMLVVGLIQTFLDFGPGTALLRKAEVSRDEIDSAWTLGILQGMGAGLMLYLSAFGFEKTGHFFTYKLSRWISYISLMTYACLKSYSFFTGANHLESGIPLGTPGAILSSGLILPL